MTDYSFLANAHPSFVEGMYRQYQQDPLSVDTSWAAFFKGFDYASNSNGASTGGTISTDTNVANLIKEFSVASLIHGYRDRGHLLSDTNPIRPRRDRKPHLRLENYNLAEADMNTVFFAGEELGLKNATLGQIVAHLQKIYSGHIGYEYTHIENREQRMWLRERIENSGANYGLTIEKKKRILEKLNGAVGFEQFLATKYVSQKRFGLEGGETTIAALDAIINKGAEDKVEEVVIGMAHRGRLNVLANIMGKTYENIFNEFQGATPTDLSFGDGDVKYHMGYSSQVVAPSGKTVHLKLSPNPSHLEAVNPVVEGFARAKADMLYNHDYDRILPILIHGDAAAVGQGIVYETAQMSGLKGYYTGGTVHFVINNQIGFTTDFDDARTSTYCTAAGNMIQVPIFHVNGDDPEAVIFISELAAEYRQVFNTDVFIDMVCYRKNGHNESDNPEFTQPELYALIKSHPNPREIYTKQLVEHGEIEKALAEQMERSFWNDLQARLDEVTQHPLPYKYQEHELAWKELKKYVTDDDVLTSPATGITKEKVAELLQIIVSLPEDFTPLRQVERIIDGQRKLLADGKADWAMGELMAYASILDEGKNVRMSGQDVKRATFSHRHAVIKDAKTYREFNRIASLEKEDNKFYIYNSLLSEFAVLGFEYGYSLASPDSLVLWEAQFGDFSNGAQTMMDQFISAGYSKWQRQSGLVMLLPHGYEGQGPEHSSARLERYLQLCAENNMTVTNITTAANLFHALRRQLARPFRMPLINMSPKSGLREPLSISPIEDFMTGKAFQEVIGDVNVGKKVRKVLFCTGKIYHDLAKYQTANSIKDVAIVRCEQLYPFPEAQVQAIMKQYKGATYCWVQEEPQNMGAWQFIISRYSHLAWQYIGRKISASPAVGYLKIHNQQQAELVAKAFS